MTMLNRRSLITGLISLVAAPAIVRVANIMPVKQTLPSTVAPADVVWCWTSGHPWNVGDVFEIYSTPFRVESVESCCNVNEGKLWSYVMGKALGSMAA